MRFEPLSPPLCLRFQDLGALFLSDLPAKFILANLTELWIFVHMDTRAVPEIMILGRLPVTPQLEQLRELANDQQAGGARLRIYQMELIENQNLPLFSSRAKAIDRVRMAIKEKQPDAILARPTTFPSYLTPEDFEHPVIICNLGVGDEHLKPYKNREPHIRLILSESEKPRDGSARSVAQLTLLLALMLSRRAHHAIAFGHHKSSERFHNQHRMFLDSRLLEGTHWFCFGSGRQVRFLLPLLWSIGIKRVTLCNRSLSEQEYAWVTKLIPNASRTATSDGAMHVEAISNPDREKTISHAERDALLSQADVVSLHIPANSEVRVNESMLVHLKPSAFLINVSRSLHLDEPAAVAALEAGLRRGSKGISGLAADVFEAEGSKKPTDSPLWRYCREQEQRRIEDRANVILLPHIGGSTIQAFEGFCGEIFPRLLKELGITGGSPPGPKIAPSISTTL